MGAGDPLAARRVLEDLLDNYERAAGREPAAPARWSLWVRLVRRAFGLLSSQAARV